MTEGAARGEAGTGSRLTETAGGMKATGGYCIGGERGEGEKE